MIQPPQKVREPPRQPTEGSDLVERPAAPPPRPPVPEFVPPETVAMRLYFPFWTQTEGAAAWFRARGCRVRLTEGSRSIVVRGPRRAVISGMQLWQGSPVAPADPSRGEGEVPPPPEAPRAEPGVNAPRHDQDPVFMPPMRTGGRQMAHKETTDRGDVSMEEPEQDFRVKFASERRARHFGSALLRKVRGVKVSFEGTTVKVRHHPRHASDVFGLAARSSRSPFMRRRGRDGSRTGGQGSLMFGFAMAGDPNHAKYDWTIQFEKPTDLAAVFARLQLKGADVTRTTARKLTIHNRSNTEVLQYYNDGTIEHAFSPKPAGPPTSSGVGPGGRGPGSTGGNIPQNVRDRSPYSMPGRGAGETFVEFAIGFASVIAAALAAQKLQQNGIQDVEIDRHGGLVAGVRDVTAKLLRTVVQSFGGKVRSSRRVRGAPTPKPAVQPPPQTIVPEDLRLKRYQQKGAKQGRERYRERKGKGYSFAAPPGTAKIVLKFLGIAAAQTVAFELIGRGIEAVASGAQVLIERLSSKDEPVVEQVTRRHGGRVVRKASASFAMGGAPETLQFVFDTATNPLVIAGALAYLRSKGLRAVNKKGEKSIVAKFTEGADAKVKEVIQTMDSRFDAAVQRIPGVHLRPAQPMITPHEEAVLRGARKVVNVTGRAAQGAKSVVRGAKRAAWFVVPHNRKEAVLAAAVSAGAAATLTAGYLAVKGLTAGVKALIERMGGRETAGPQQQAASMGVVDSLLELTGGRHRDRHGRSLTGGKRVRDTPENREITERHGAERIGGIGERARDDAGRFKSAGMAGESRLVRAAVSVWRSELGPAVEAIRQAGARLLGKKFQATPGGVVKAVLVVEGTRQAVKDVRRVLQEDPAASMALPVALVAGVYVLEGIAALLTSAYAIRELQRQGVEAKLTKSKKVVARGPRKKVEAVAKEVGATVREVKPQAASMDAKSDYHEGYFRGKPMPQGGTRVQQVKDAQRRVDELRARRARERAEYDRQKEQLLHETTGRRDDHEIHRQYNELVREHDASKGPGKSNIGLVALGIWAPLLVPVLIGLGIKAYKTAQGWFARPKDRGEAATVEREIKKAKAKKKGASMAMPGNLVSGSVI